LVAFFLVACSTPKKSVPPVSSLCPGAVPWSSASSYSGQSITVSGPVISTDDSSSSNGAPTFLNIGADYPDPSRFTVVIWGENRANFPSAPEDLYRGKSVCVSGTVTIYQSRPEIEVTAPGQIQSSA
jgi:hypothetical protein